MLTVSPHQPRKSLEWSVLVTYIYLGLGTVIMFGPVLWLLTSSFKSPAELVKFPPRFLPYRQETVMVPGHDAPLPLFEVEIGGEVKRLAQTRRVGIQAHMIDPANPEGERILVNINARTPIESISFNLDNYVQGIKSFNFWRYLRNSVIVTVVATIITLIINSMAAFALSKYKFRGRDAIFLLFIATLMVPLPVILVPIFMVITQIGWNNSLWGVIIPGAATPTGVFLLRQYMVTIPDELLDAARIDGSSEWRIYLQIILPLARPALAVLTIFSVVWRWNDFLWPLIVLSRTEMFTLQVGLNSFQGELNVQWHLILAMTVLTILPVTVVFGFLQKYISTGIATTGLK
ncbi:binding-protein-dependent transport systems inner membrane component [Candidatus Vecturithrix granuli]|uniref:Binding-protein-dependent transport systems inner membrane component n=1 Tax=Vecturithrix granuli TaxID=1499967 RepID=A0A0S6WB60_VECG1|nr:binding-protein-dependent transport systems inner membrane component [Candidatus Vecturithrix granuli]